MIPNNQKTSLLIESQLPEYVRENPDYSNFSLFLTAYYEWLEQNGKVTERSKNILNYKDIDNTSEEFLSYFVNDFLPYFPKSSLIDQREAVKIARQLYQSKGTPASYKFLFKILFNSDFDIFYTKDAVLKASDGKWYISKSLKLGTDFDYVKTISYVGTTITVETFTPTGLMVGQTFTISGITGTNAPNGTWKVSSSTSPTVFNFIATTAPSGTLSVTNATVYNPKGFPNENFLNIGGYRILGETTKSIATIETSVIAQNKIEVFISDVQRLFESGEFIRIVNNNNQDVLVNGKPLRAKIVGQVSQVAIDSRNRGELYQPGDPVIVYDGLSSPDGIGASAIVGETTSGSIQRINVIDGGFGYTYYPNTIIQISNAPGANAIVGSLAPYLPPKFIIEDGGNGYRENDTISYQNSTFAYVTTVNAIGAITSVQYNTVINALAILGITANVFSANTQAAGAVIKIADKVSPAVANVALLPIDTIAIKKDLTIGAVEYFFANAVNHSTTSNANTSLAEALTFVELETYPISSVYVINQGGGIKSTPTVTAKSGFDTDVSITETGAERIRDQALLSSLGILAPVQILSGGQGYQVNDVIVFTGGSGLGAHANVTNVNAQGSITEIDYIEGPTREYPVGGLGYKTQYLPALTVQSANVNAFGADLIVPGILGEGATFSVVTDRVGSITKINVIDFGEDYVSTPNVSLKVQDIIVSNVSIENVPTKGDVIYQGENINVTTYSARVNSISLLAVDADPMKSLWNLRVFNYDSNPNPTKTLVIDNKNINFVMANSNFGGIYDIVYPGPTTNYVTSFNQNGVLTYGDGTAKANATFLNGLVVGQGEYLNTQGQPSSFDVLQSSIYNNFTYIVTVQKEIEKYRNILLNLLHPSGMRVLGRYALKSNSSVDFHAQEAFVKGYPLYYYTGLGSTVTMVTDFTNKSNNIIKFNNLGGSTLSNFLFENESIIVLNTTNGPNVESIVISVDDSSNTAVIDNNVWLTYANVAYGTANANSNVINITSFTGQFDIINNGNYTFESYPLRDIVFAGDSVKLANSVNVGTVTSVDYINNKIYLSSNLSSTLVSNSKLTVVRKFIANSSYSSSQVKVLGTVGQPYINPELSTESGVSITTEDGLILLVG